MIETLHAAAHCVACTAEGWKLTQMAATCVPGDDVLEEVRDGQIEVGFVHKGLDEFHGEARPAVQTGS